MGRVEDNYKEKIRNQVANIAVVVAINIGFALFNLAILIDVATITFLGGLIYIYNSRIASLGVVVFGCIALFFQLPHFNDASGCRLAAFVWLVIAGMISLYYSLKYHAKHT
ncbi:hypothetical protein [Shewanella aestuarii]|uniref:Uncharacterized protein n=1 Tax=Shewanella aestuarii TaxID=1028752 RepID=A0A6G9QJG5_9GAMM|nr:hypothetical protein [Shewanella aestuarii]QIR14019.1 hypothetical protein HBH39_05475 [Shewanella aestuarii]